MNKRELKLWDEHEDYMEKHFSKYLKKNAVKYGWYVEDGNIVSKIFTKPLKTLATYYTTDYGNKIDHYVCES